MPQSKRVVCMSLRNHPFLFSLCFLPPLHFSRRADPPRMCFSLKLNSSTLLTSFAFREWIRGSRMVISRWTVVLPTPKTFAVPLTVSLVRMMWSASAKTLCKIWSLNVNSPFLFTSKKSVGWRRGGPRAVWLFPLAVAAPTRAPLCLGKFNLPPYTLTLLIPLKYLKNSLICETP